jgi:hypothetical protein
VCGSIDKHLQRWRLLLLLVACVSSRAITHRAASLREWQSHLFIETRDMLCISF